MLRLLHRGGVDLRSDWLPHDMNPAFTVRELVGIRMGIPAAFRGLTVDCDPNTK